jgi:hypothetical protein
MTRDSLPALSSADLDAQSARLLPDKELVSLLDLNVDLDLAIDLSAPIDLAVAANANVAAPIDAAVSANLLTIGSSAAAQASQDALIVQDLDADAIATAPQTAVIDQSNDVVDGGATQAAPPGDVAAAPVGAAEDTTGAIETGASPTDVAPAADVVDGASGVTDALGNEVSGVTSGGLLDGNLLNVDVNVALDADVAAPIAGAVAANANVAAPIDAAAAANVGTIDSEAVAIADQTAIIQQTLTGTAEATADQDATITQ